MDWYEKLSRLLMRRKYARVEDRSSSGPPLMAKSKSVKIPGSEKKFKRSSRSSTPCTSEQPPVVVMPKRFTLHSSTNEVIDGAWFNSALRRSVAEGRLNMSNVL